MRYDDFLSWKHGIRYTEHPRISITGEHTQARCSLKCEVTDSHKKSIRFPPSRALLSDVETALDSQARACFRGWPRGFFYSVLPSASARSSLQTRSSSSALGVELRSESRLELVQLAPLHFSASA